LGSCGSSALVTTTMKHWVSCCIGALPTNLLRERCSEHMFIRVNAHLVHVIQLRCQSNWFFKHANPFLDQSGDL
jgi:hypothetical protein